MLRLLRLSGVDLNCGTGRGLPLDEDGGDLVDVALAALDPRAHRDVDLLADLVSVLLELQEELHVGDPLETRPADRPVGVVLLQMEDAFTASFIFDPLLISREYRDTRIAQLFAAQTPSAIGPVVRGA